MRDQVARENRKALPRFFGTVLLFALLGGAGGFLVSIAGFSGLADRAAEGLAGLLGAVVPWGIPVSSAILLGIGLLPVLMVLIVFGALQVTYCLTCIKLSRSR